MNHNPSNLQLHLTGHAHHCQTIIQVAVAGKMRGSGEDLNVRVCGVRSAAFIFRMPESLVRPRPWSAIHPLQAASQRVTLQRVTGREDQVQHNRHVTGGVSPWHKLPSVRCDRGDLNARDLLFPVTPECARYEPPEFNRLSSTAAEITTPPIQGLRSIENLFQR